MRASFLLVATLPIIFSGLSAQAETIKSANSGAIAQSAPGRGDRSCWESKGELSKDRAPISFRYNFGSTSQSNKC